MRKDQLHGGLADNKDYSEFNRKQLRIGQKVEMEHTNDPVIAREIAGDHLEEIDDYYTRLNQMEEEAEHGEDGVILGVTPKNEIVILTKTPSGRYDIHKFDNDNVSDKPVKVSNYDRNTGHVNQHYRSKRMR